MADGNRDVPGQSGNRDNLSRIRDGRGRFVKSAASGPGTALATPAPPAYPLDSLVDPDISLAYAVGLDHEGPLVLPDPATLPADFDFTSLVDDGYDGGGFSTISIDSTNPMPFAKWAGEPSDGGMGGSVNSTRDDTYDPQRKPGPYTEVGASGLAQYGGFVREEFLLVLQGNNARKVYREMWDNNPIVGAIIFAIQMLIRRVECRVEPPEAGTVEEIVQERYLDRQAQAQEHQQALQQRTMEAQAGLAGNSASATRQGPDGKPAGPMPPKGPIPSMASGPLANAPGLHEPINVPSINAPSTGPGNNAPATPNSPGSNPSGGPATADAQGLEPGLPGAGAGAGAGRNRMSKSERVLSRARAFFKNAPPSDGEQGQGQAGQLSGQPTTNPLDPGSPGSVATTPTTGTPYEPNGDGADSTDPNGTPRDQHAEEMAVFVETCFHDMADSWSDTLAQIITMIVYGFAFHEIVYKKRNGPNPDYPDQGSRFSDGKIGWAKLAGRGQETLHRWEFDDNGDVLGFWQLAPPKFRLKYIPLAKALLFRTSAYKNNPEGRSVLRSAYRPWYFLKRIEEYEAVGVERDLAGLPVAYVPYQYMTASATPEERAALNEIKKMVRNVRTNEQAGIVMPNMIDPDSHEKLFSIELLASPSKRQFDTDKIITRYEQRIAMNVLADFIMLGHDSVGARSLGETKVDLFSAAMDAWLNAIADVFNTYAIPRLMQMNGEDPAESPKLSFGKVGEVPLDQVAQMITAMAGAGADLFPDTQLEDTLRSRMSWPNKAASDEL